MDQELSTSLPRGFNFQLNDTGDIYHYLKQWVSGGVLPPQIKVVNVNDFEPWDLPRDDSMLKTRDRECYIFSKLSRKYEKSSSLKFNRTTREGFWKSTTKDREVRHNSRHVMMKKIYTFHARRARRTNWVMHEYRLVEKEFEKDGISLESQVRCKIFEKRGKGLENEEASSGEEAATEEVAVGDGETSELRRHGQNFIYKSNMTEEHEDLLIPNIGGGTAALRMTDGLRHFGSGFTGINSDFIEGYGRSEFSGTENSSSHHTTVTQRHEIGEAVQVKESLRLSKSLGSSDASSSVHKPEALTDESEEHGMDANSFRDDELYIDAQDLSIPIKVDSADLLMADDFLNLDYDLPDMNFYSIDGFDPSELLGTENASSPVTLKNEIGEADQVSRLSNLQGRNDASSSKNNPKALTDESGKECPKLSSEEQGSVKHIPKFSQLPENAKWMRFGNIVTNSALWKRSCYQIPIDKVLWDRQGNPKKPSLPSKKVVSGLPTQRSSKKSQAHKNASSKPITDQADMASKSSSHPKVQGSLSDSVAGEGSSVTKRKSGGDAPTSGPPLKKGGRVEKERELLQTIAFVRSNSAPKSFRPQEYPDERPDLWDLVRKISNREGASSSQGSSEVEHLRHLLAAREKEIVKSQRRCAELELANVQLLNQADEAERKSRNLAKHVEEVDAEFLKLTMEFGKMSEELCQARTSEEGFQKLNKTLETQLSASKDAREKLVADLASSKTQCESYRCWYHHWKAKAARYFTELSFIPWLRDLKWSRGFHWGFENCRLLVIHRESYKIDPATVASDYLGIPTAAIDEMMDSGRELFPDAPKINPHGFSPTPILPPEPVRPKIDPSDDEDDAAAGPSS